MITHEDWQMENGIFDWARKNEVVLDFKRIKPNPL
jgi:hypothetical protein